MHPATGLTHDLGFLVSCIGWPAFPASEARFFLHWSRGIWCIDTPGMASSTRPRIADVELRVCPGSAGAVVITGPKACGKTRLAQQLAASALLLDVNTAARQALEVDPATASPVGRMAGGAANGRDAVWGWPWQPP